MARHNVKKIMSEIEQSYLNNSRTKPIAASDQGFRDTLYILFELRRAFEYFRLSDGQPMESFIESSKLYRNMNMY